jgi:transcriptional regulator with XRE-family HTH domain
MVVHRNKTVVDIYVIERVKAMRLEAGMSQAVLGVKLEVSPTFIGNAEISKNKEKYNLNHINKLAKIFGCSPKDFLPEEPL